MICCLLVVGVITVPQQKLRYGTPTAGKLTKPFRYANTQKKGRLEDCISLQDEKVRQRETPEQIKEKHAFYIKRKDIIMATLILLLLHLKSNQHIY